MLFHAAVVSDCQFSTWHPQLCNHRPSSSGLSIMQLRVHHLMHTSISASEPDDKPPRKAGICHMCSTSTTCAKSVTCTVVHRMNGGGISRILPTRDPSHCHAHPYRAKHAHHDSRRPVRRQSLVSMSMPGCVRVVLGTVGIPWLGTGPGSSGLFRSSRPPSCVMLAIGHQAPLQLVPSVDISPQHRVSRHVTSYIHCMILDSRLL